MKWVTWYNLNSGNQTTRAHVVSNYLVGRTECGWPVPALTNAARGGTPKCKACLSAMEAMRKNGGVK
jgi:hypothetical protein